MRLDVAEFGSSGTIIGVVESLTNSVCGIGETRLAKLCCLSHFVIHQFINIIYNIGIIDI